MVPSQGVCRNKHACLLPAGPLFTRFRLPATARLKSLLRERLRRAWPVLFGCLRAPDERPLPLSHALLAIVEHSMAPFPWGWAYARGPDPILRRVVMPLASTGGPSVRKDYKRSAGSQTGWKTPHHSVFRISAGQVVVLSTTRLPHRSSLSAPQPICQ